jgi:hypothetical protein
LGGHAASLGGPASAGGAPSVAPASIGADGASAASPSGWCTGVELHRPAEHIWSSGQSVDTTHA